MGPSRPPLRLPGGRRPTRQRKAILDAIERRSGSFTVKEIFDTARERDPRLGLATAYRTIELLRSSGAITALPGGDRPAYVRCHPGHHHHLVCLSCGGVEETELCGAPPADELRRRYGFLAHGHELDVYGTCRACA